MHYRLDFGLFSQNLLYIFLLPDVSSPSTAVIINLSLVIISVMSVIQMVRHITDDICCSSG